VRPLVLFVVLLRFPRHNVNIAGRQTTPLIFVETNPLALYVATTVIKWDTLLETVTMSHTDALIGF
jgi:hypothetical protein